MDTESQNIFVIMEENAKLRMLVRALWAVYRYKSVHLGKLITDQDSDHPRLPSA